MSKENYTQEEAKEELIQAVILNIAEDLDSGVWDEIIALLKNVPLEDLIEFLPEKEAELYEVKHVQEKKLIIK